MLVVAAHQVIWLRVCVCVWRRAGGVLGVLVVGDCGEVMSGDVSGEGASREAMAGWRVARVRVGRRWLGGECWWE